MSHLNIDRLMAARGIDRQEAERILGDPALVDALILTGDIGLHTAEVTALPGISASLLTSGCDPTREVCPFIPTTSPLIGGTMPAGIVAPNWQELTRIAIDRIMAGFGGPTSTTLQEGPLVLPEISGTPGLFPPGGLQGPVGGSGGCVPCRKPKVGFIVMPNGLPGCPSGYHPEKSGKPYCVRNRRMNSLNPRALSRATRRVGGFARAVKRARTLKKVCRSL